MESCVADSGWLFALGSLGNLLVERTLLGLQSLSIYQQADGEIRFHSISDRARVVTRLVQYGDNEGEKRTAVLSQPLVIVDSSGAKITADQVKKLSWVNIYGRPVAPPAIGSKIHALYFSASIASAAD